MKITSLKKRINNMPEAAKAAVAFALSSIIIRGISFLVTPIFTRIMSTGQYGMVTVYNSWQTIIEVISLLGLTSAGIFNVGLNDYRKNREQYVFTVLIICNIFTVIVFGLIYLVQTVLKTEIFMSADFLLVMFFHFMFYPSQIFWVTKQRYEYKYKLATIITLSSAFLSQIVSVIFVLNVNENESAFFKILATNLVTIVFCVPIYISIIVKGKKILPKIECKKIILFAFTLLPHYLAQHIMAGADRIMISELISSSDAAIYAVVSSISLIAVIVWNSINSSLIPLVYENLNKKLYDRINKIIIPIIFVYALFCVAIVLIAPEIIMLLAPVEYAHGVYAVPPIVIVSFFNALYNIFSMIEFYHKESKSIALATIISCVINIILNYIFIPIFGFVAAGYSTMVSNIVLVIMHYRGYRKCQQDKVYKEGIIAGISFGCVLVCMLCNILYMNSVIRYIIVAIMALLLFIYRKKIISLYKLINKP